MRNKRELLEKHCLVNNWMSSFLKRNKEQVVCGINSIQKGLKKNPMTQGWLCGSEVKALATKPDKLSWILKIHKERTDSHRLSSVLHHVKHIHGHVHIPVHIHTHSIHVYTYTHTRTLNARLYFKSMNQPFGDFTVLLCFDRISYSPGWPQMTLNFWSSCLSLLSAGASEVCHSP